MRTSLLPLPHWSSRLARGLLALLMGWVWTGDINLALAQQQSSAVSASARAGMDELAKLYRAIDAAERAVPRQSFDVDAVVNQVGKDPVRLFEWVRDQTFWVPYRGLLRGDRGVLMDRLGNSVDRAMLLYSLLKAAGKNARLAHAPLDASRAQELAGRIRPVPQICLPREQASLDAADQWVEQLCKQNSLDPAALRASMQRCTLSAEKNAEDVVSHVQQQAPALIAAVGRPSATTAVNLIDAIQDHWWTQLLNDDGSVTDLDPLLPDAKPGASIATAAATFQPKGLADLGESNLQLLEIRAVIGVLSDGKMQESTVLTQKLLPAGMFGMRIVLRHTPLHWPGDVNLGASDPLEALRKAALAQDEWMPVLLVGEHRVARYTFDDSGMMGDNTLPTFAQNAMAGRKFAQSTADSAAHLGSNVGGMLGGGRIGAAGMGRGNAAPAKPASHRPQLVAEWLEYTLSVPGQPPLTLRRTLFDLATDASQTTLSEQQRLTRSLALLGETEILALPCQLSPAFVQSLELHNALENRSKIEDLLARADLGSARGMGEGLARLAPPPGPLYALALDRRVCSRHAADTYLACPNILTQHTWLEPASDASGKIRACHAIDIVLNKIESRPGADKTATPFDVQLEQGVVDSNLEHVLLSGCGRADAGALRDAQAWTTIRSTDDLAKVDPALAADQRKLIEKDLTDGFVCLVPRQNPGGWWRVNPQTGETLGIGPRGWGQASEEYYLGMTQEAWATVVICLVSYAIWLLCATNPEKANTVAQLRCAGVALTGITSAGFGPFVAALVAGIPAVIDSIIDRASAGGGSSSQRHE